MKHRWIALFLAGSLLGCSEGGTPADSGNGTSDDASASASSGKTESGAAALDKAAIEASIQKGVEYLRKQFDDNGVIQMDVGGRVIPSPPFTAFATTAIARSMPKDKRAADPLLQKAQAYLLGMVEDDGKVPGDIAKYHNYYTASTIMALAAIGDPKTAETRTKMANYILGIQRQEKDRVEGGFGYNSKKSADLSNTQYAIEALRAAGIPEDHPQLQEAIKFLERAQNRSENEANKGVKHDIAEKKIVPGNDGSATYEPGVSKAGLRKLPDGTYEPIGYGSMTYALLKSYILCGLDKDDARVQAVLKWLGENYTWTENPGFETTVRESSREDAAQARHWGHFYYMVTAAKALNLLGQDELQTEDGPRNWRADLSKQLMDMQRGDGHWVNTKANRWLESDPKLVSCMAVIALQEVLDVD
ncbi:MAG: prenyltransferase/squalene oxidase repeat-containing protein [Planctomycetota bacterium]